MKTLPILTKLCLAMAVLACLSLTAAAADGAKEAGKGAKSPADRAAAALAKFDTNNDGSLDATELTAMLAAHHHHGKKGGGQANGAGGKAGGEHKRPSAEELIKKFDTNNDGKLNATELAAMFAAHHHHGKKGEKPAGNNT